MPPVVKRSCSNRNVTRALDAGDRPPTALLLPDAEDCEACETGAQLQASLMAEPGAIIVYNRQADAIRPVESLEISRARVFIEIRQDTGARRACGRGTSRSGRRGTGIVSRVKPRGIPAARGD